MDNIKTKKGLKMKKKKYLLMTIGIIFVFAMTIFLVNQKAVNAQEIRTVRLHGGLPSTQDIIIEPETLFVSKGTIVIWVNLVPTKEVKVIFEEGKKCQEVTNAPEGFEMTFDDCYVTAFITQAGTSSLKFNEEGVFEYVVEAAGDTKAKVKGKITVGK